MRTCEPAPARPLADSWPGDLHVGSSKSKLFSRPTLDRSVLADQDEPGPCGGGVVPVSLYVESTRSRISRRAFFENWMQNGQEASSFPIFKEITTGDPTSCRWLRREASGGGLHAAVRAAAPEVQAGSIVRPTMRRLLRLVPSHMRHHLEALTTNPPAPLGRPTRGDIDIGLASRGLESRLRAGEAMESGRYWPEGSGTLLSWGAPIWAMALHKVSAGLNNAEPANDRDTLCH